ncbi:MAG TPA: hypothetical protein VF796_23885, partial [Humisphaera sp.]
MWLLALILLLALYAFGPGFVLVRPLRLAPAERLVAAVGVGLFAVYALSFALFALALPSLAQLAVPCVAVTFAVVGWRGALATLRSRQVRRMLLAWLAVLVFGLLLLSMVRHYGGGTWGGDWQEHFERTTFFREYDPTTFGFKFIGQYPLPMRPPVMNVLAANLLNITAVGMTPGADYEPFQLSFFFLNSLVALPCFLLVGRVVKLPPRLARKATWTLALLLAASPAVAQNLTYAWTKLFAAFYALAAIAIYLRAWRRR